MEINHTNHDWPISIVHNNDNRNSRLVLRNFEFVGVRNLFISKIYINVSRWCWMLRWLCDVTGQHNIIIWINYINLFNYVQMISRFAEMAGPREQKR